MLPKDRTLADSLESFWKTNLEKLLPSFKDTPPISGDETQIPNSLLDRPIQGKKTTEYYQADDCRVRWPCESLTIPAQRHDVNMLICFPFALLITKLKVDSVQYTVQHS